MLKYNRFLLALILFSVILNAQNADPKHAGTYKQNDGKVIFTLNPDGTFIYQPYITTLDQAITNTNDKSNITISSGNWVSDSNLIILNPDKVPKEMVVETIENNNLNKDYITIKLKYFQYPIEIINNTSIEKIEVDFPMWTIFVNNTNKPIQLFREIKLDLLTSQAKEEKIYLDNSNTFRIPKKGFKKIGIYNINFENIFWYSPSDLNKNSFIFEFNVPEAFQNSLRSKQLIIKNNKLYQCVKDGKIDKSMREIPLTKVD